MFNRLAGLTARRGWRVVAAALAFAALAAVFGGGVAGVMSNDRADFDAAGSESEEARQRLAEASGANPGADIIALVELEEDARSCPGNQEAVLSIAQRIADDPDVGRISTFYDTGDAGMVSEDGYSTYITVGLEPGVSGDEAAERLEEEFAGDENVSLGGVEVFGSQVVEVLDEDLVRAEVIAFPILLLLSLWIFRGLIAALLPLLIAGLAVVGALLGLRIATEAVPISVFALNAASALSMGLAIDYSLLILSRYREEMARVGPGRQALANTLATAGRTVLLSSLTVALALSSLVVFPPRFFYSMAIAGVMVALLSAAAALVVLPAILSLLGQRVNALSLPRWQIASEEESHSVSSGRWYRFARAVMRRPGLAALASSLLLLCTGLPLLGVQFTADDAGVLPEDASARQVSDVLEEDFPHGGTTPLHLAVAVPDDEAIADELSSYATSLEELPNVETVSPPRSLDAETWQIDLLPAAEDLSQESRQLVRDVREFEAPYPVEVAGWNASFVDRQESLVASLPAALAVVFVSTFVLLFLLTGSVVVPAKTFLMNLLTVVATFGILVWVFQHGRLEGLLGYESQGALENTQPIVILILAFALSTDYGVFLISRIKEAHDSGLDNEEAVAVGVGRTGRIVTAAALLFCVAVGALATSHIVSLKQLGVGAALAVLIDATLVRAFLVPSLMKLLGGKLNWWAPRPLKLLHERVGLDESGPPKPAESSNPDAEAMRDLAAAASRLTATVDSEDLDPGRSRAVSLAVDDAWDSFTRMSSWIPPSITAAAIVSCSFRTYTLPDIAGWIPPRVPDAQALRELAGVAACVAEALERGRLEPNPEQRRALRDYAADAWLSFVRIAHRDLDIRPKDLL